MVAIAMSNWARIGLPASSPIHTACRSLKRRNRCPREPGSSGAWSNGKHGPPHVPTAAVPTRPGSRSITRLDGPRRRGGEHPLDQAALARTKSRSTGICSSIPAGSCPKWPRARAQQAGPGPSVSSREKVDEQAMAALRVQRG